ncbi:MAG TPA: TIGR04211 family SH3 domain-containing protein [Steroidobacteraceae bacterium]|nr:TIGR04211 family SH3 domain-containing protein [Steroidobacteraceae bacterium]
MSATTPVTLLALALLTVPVARAEDLYVIDQLAVSVKSAAGGGGERVATLKSGERVEALERAGTETHVRLENGKDGWVPSSYLTAQEPARAKLNEREAEISQLKTQVGELESQLSAARTAATTRAAPSAPAETAPAPATSPAGGAQSPPLANAPPDANPAAMSPPQGTWFTSTLVSPARPSWPWALGGALIALPLGFALGWVVLDARIRRKYGGLRIY